MYNITYHSNMKYYYSLSLIDICRERSCPYLSKWDTNRGLTPYLIFNIIMGLLFFTIVILLDKKIFQMTYRYFIGKHEGNYLFHLPSEYIQL